MCRRLFHSAKRLLAGTRGETLVESLVSVLIVAAAMLMLTTAIVTAAKINATADQNVSAVNESQAVASNDVSVTFAGDDISSGTSAKVEGQSFTIKNDDGSDANTYYYFKVKN